MLTEEQIEVIAQSCFENSIERGGTEWDDPEPSWDTESPKTKRALVDQTRFVVEKALAIEKLYAEQDRRSFIAVGKYIGIPFTAGTDVVSEVYSKLDEIMTVFREHSQEIAIAQQIKTLNNLLEKYIANQDTTPISPRTVGAEAGEPICAGEISISGPQD